MDEDLYADLLPSGQGGAECDASVAYLEAKVLELEDALAEYKTRFEGLQHEVQHATSEVTKLTGERNVLLHNISTLYNTAKAELDRKAREITELRVSVARQPGSSVPQTALPPPPPRAPIFDTRGRAPGSHKDREQTSAHAAANGTEARARMGSGRTPEVRQDSAGPSDSKQISARADDRCQADRRSSERDWDRGRDRGWERDREKERDRRSDGTGSRDGRRSDIITQPGQRSGNTRDERDGRDERVSKRPRHEDTHTDADQPHAGRHSPSIDASGWCKVESRIDGKAASAAVESHGQEQSKGDAEGCDAHASRRDSSKQSEDERGWGRSSSRSQHDSNSHGHAGRELSSRAGRSFDGHASSHAQGRVASRAGTPMTEAH